MKKKFRLWFNIVTICLCVCAIAIGVYAATSATLTVSGTIGFEAHGLSFTATAKAKCYVTDPDDPSTYKADYQTFDNLTNNKITLDDMYFTDLVGETVPTIEIQISITNGSLFPVEAMLSLPETTLLQTNITFDVGNGLAQMGDTNDTDTKTQTITIKMTLNNAETTDLEELQGLNFTISLSKLAKIKGDSTNGYYMTMGSKVVTTNSIQQVQPVKWLPFAESSDGTTWTAFDNTNKPDNSKQYYFISEKVLDVGDVAFGATIPNETLKSGIRYNYSNSSGFDETYNTLAGNNYLATDVREFLKGATKTKNNKQENLFDIYNISGYVYNTIKPRTASDLYEKDSKGNEFSTINQTYSMLTTGDNEADKLWLLSNAEVNYLSAEQKSAITFNQDYGSYWWLRTPGQLNDNYGTAVTKTASIVPIMPDTNEYGIRPAFQFDLSK